MMNLKVKLTDGAPLPRHARPGDAGMDLTSRETVEIAPGGTVMVHTGVWMEIPDGYYGEIVPRSGMASKRGVTLANAPATIDSGYRGEILIPLHNIASALRLVKDANGHTSHYEPNHDLAVVERGERVAQIIIKRHETVRCVEVEELSETERGEGGFGSTGV
jgi:dUTP pyrophosphatase